jgi:hypothetical protein
MRSSKSAEQLPRCVVRVGSTLNQVLEQRRKWRTHGIGSEIPSAQSLADEFRDSDPSLSQQTLTHRPGMSP